MSENNQLDNIIVVVRGVHERTEKVCVDIVEHQVGKANTEIVHEHPFSKAHYRSLEIGIESGKKWTAVIDADCLLRKNVITELLQAAEKLPADAFLLHSQMLDKYFGGYRHGGIKVYRTKYLPTALKLVPLQEGVKKPETAMIKAMRDQGYTWQLSDIKTCMHDFEQYYKEAIRKGYMYAKKHDMYTNILLPYWRRASQADSDFAVMLKGMELAENYKDEVLKLDFQELEEKIDLESVLKEMGLSEKLELSVEDFPEGSVDNFMNSYQTPPEYEQVKKVIDSNLPQNKVGINKFISRLKSRIQ